MTGPLRQAALRAAIALGIALPAAVGGSISAGADQPLRIVALGDSLTAGYGLRISDSFPARLQDALRRKGFAVEIINAGVSGDTASDGLARLDWAVPDNTDAVILELGANDALRGINPNTTRKALEAMLQSLRERGLPVLLTGMLAPRNLGKTYVAAFDGLYSELADSYQALLYPFFLEGVATERALNQGDGVHPNAAGVVRIVEGILPKVEELIAQAKARRDRTRG